MFKHKQFGREAYNTNLMHKIHDFCWFAQQINVIFQELYNLLGGLVKVQDLDFSRLYL